MPDVLIPSELGENPGAKQLVELCGAAGFLLQGEVGKWNFSDVLRLVVRLWKVLELETVTKKGQMFVILFALSCGFLFVLFEYVCEMLA